MRISCPMLKTCEKERDISGFNLFCYGVELDSDTMPYECCTTYLKAVGEFDDTVKKARDWVR